MRRETAINGLCVPRKMDLIPADFLLDCQNNRHIEEGEAERVFNVFSSLIISDRAFYVSHLYWNNLVDFLICEATGGLK